MKDIKEIAYEELLNELTRRVKEGKITDTEKLKDLIETLRRFKIIK